MKNLTLSLFKENRLCAAFLLLLCFLCQISQANAQGLVDKPFGWASNVTGGGSANPVTVSSNSKFRSAVSGDHAKVIYIAGTIDLGVANPASVGSNTTIIGLGDNARFLHGGLVIHGKTNIIIRNVSFEDARDPNWQCERPVEGGQPSNCEAANAEYDNLSIQGRSTKIWVDHCTFSNNQTTSLAYDGLLDIKNGSDFITVSYCIFKNNDKSLLVGASDSDAGYYRITYAYNWFQGIASRAPMIRFGRVHLLNNYYTNIRSYAIGVRHNSRIYAEKNYFYNTRRPSDQGSTTGQIRNVGNKFVNCSPNSFAAQVSSVGWMPAYSYTALNVDDVPGHVQAYAGVGKVVVKTICDGCTEIPEGNYVLTVRHSGKALDVYGWSSSSGGNIVQWAAAGYANQQWVIKSAGGGYYSITSVHSGLSLDVEGYSTNNGANIQQWGYNPGQKNQEFSFEDLGNGYYRIKARHSGQCIDVAGRSTEDGANVIQWTCGSGYNQQWKLTPLNSAYAANSSAEKEMLNNDTSNAEKLIVYPNPSTSTFIIETEGRFTFSIYDQAGRVVEKGSGQNKVQAGDSFGTGLYLIVIKNEKEVRQIKLFKK